MPEDYFCILINTKYFEVLFAFTPFTELAIQSICNKDLNQDILVFLKSDFLDIRLSLSDSPVTLCMFLDA